MLDTKNRSTVQQHHFIVEGNIGAGKSTFVKLLQRMLPVHGVFEPCERWQNVVDGGNILEQFYKDPQRWAYTFQTYAFVTRILEQKQQAQNNATPIHILERSVFSDRYVFAKHCFELGFMNTLEWKLYQEWFSWLVDTYMTKPTGFIYLQTTPDTCMARMAKRNRNEENAVPQSYIEGIHTKHEAWLIHKQGIMDNIRDVPVLTLPCNQDFEHDVRLQQQYADTVQEFIQCHTGMLPGDTNRIHPSVTL